MQKSIDMKRLTLGVCYYPEHWPEELWADDLARMKEAGLTVIRIAEFAWNKFEPREGTYTFEFFDRFMKLVETTDMKVIFCTPTATPPAWLTEKYPEVLNATMDGTLYRHGMRRHYNYNSPVYQEFTCKIVERMARHYASHPSIIGWQIDNEINCGTDVFYSEADHAAFRLWVEKKYGSLDSLNAAWGTEFWNQTYTDWQEIHLPRFTGERKSPNPHMALDEKRFFSDSAIAYCKLQYDILKGCIDPDKFVTTNGLFGHLDYNSLSNQAIDFLTYDSYPTFGFESLGGINNRGFDDQASADSKYNLNDRKWGWFLSTARAFSPNFGVMEQQSGAGGWVNRMKASTPKPGQIRLWTLQSIAHGADFVSYFRWRTATFGTEIYWHGILDYSNRSNRKLQEIADLSREIQAIGSLTGSKVKAKLAIIRDYDNQWDGEYDIWHGPLRAQSEVGWFVAAELTHTPFDIVYMNAETTSDQLSHYDLVVYPHATILTESVANRLKDYVRQGGSLVMGARSGYKDEYGRCYMKDMPGYAADLFGIRIEDFTHLNYKNAQEKALWGDDTLNAVLFNDILIPTAATTEVLATYQGNYYTGEPALTVNSYGAGKAYYFGAAFDPETAMTILGKLGQADPYADLLGLPDSCELCVREQDGKKHFFVLGFGDVPVNLQVKKPMTDLLSGKTLQGVVELPAYGVLVLA